MKRIAILSFVLFALVACRDETTRKPVAPTTAAGGDGGTVSLAPSTGGAAGTASASGGAPAVGGSAPAPAVGGAGGK